MFCKFDQIHCVQIILTNSLLYCVSCSDSILINGRGSVYCPGTANISSVELPYLSTAINNQPLTDKG